MWNIHEHYQVIETPTASSVIYSANLFAIEAYLSSGIPLLNWQISSLERREQKSTPASAPHHVMQSRTNLSAFWYFI